jgi:hypothetical protein
MNGEPATAPVFAPMPAETVGQTCLASQHAKVMPNAAASTTAAATG